MPTWMCFLYVILIPLAGMIGAVITYYAGGGSKKDKESDNK